MYKRLKGCASSAERLLAEGGEDVDWGRACEDLLTQIGFFQHERLIHLLVTLAFALMVCACALVTILTYNMVSCLLMGLLTILLVPYVVHYYFLENETQKLYAQYDRLLAKARQRNV